MKPSSSKIERQAEKIHENEIELYRFLHEIGKTFGGESYPKFFAKYTEDPRPDIRKIAFMAFLSYSHPKSVPSEICEKALEVALDEQEDFDLRLACLSGIGNVFAGHRSETIICQLFELYKDGGEDKTIRVSAITCTLEVYGLSSKDIRERNGQIIIDFEDFEAEKFAVEIAEIEEICR